MALFSNTGLPGSGKTEYLTYLAVKHYKIENNIIRRFIRKYIKKLSDKDIYLNNVYTDYPVLLDIKNNIYSNKISINDLDNSYRLKKRAFVGIDEPQLKHDSLDFQSFPRSIGMFLQLHRHFGISKIAFATQHPNRLVMYEKNIMGIYNKMHSVLKIPLTPYKLVIIRTCYEIGDYDLISTKDKETKKMHSIKTEFKLYNANKVHRHYDDKYLAPLNENKPLLDKGTYTSLKLTNDDLKYYDDYFKKYSVKEYELGHVLNSKSSGAKFKNTAMRSDNVRSQASVSELKEVKTSSFLDKFK